MFLEDMPYKKVVKFLFSIRQREGTTPTLRIRWWNFQKPDDLGPPWACLMSGAVLRPPKDASYINWKAKGG